MKIAGLLKMVYLEHTQKINEQLKQFDLTMSQLEILVEIIIANKNNQQIRQRDLEKHLHLTNPTITGIIQRLEAKGLVLKKENESDKRIRYLYVTDKAKVLNQELKNIFETSDSITLKGFKEEEIKELEQYLLRMRNNLRREDKHD